MYWLKNHSMVTASSRKPCENSRCEAVVGERGGAGRDQQLQRQRQAGIPRQQCAHGSEGAAGTVAADGQARAVQTEVAVGLRMQPLQGGEAVVDRRRKAVLRSQPVGQCHHGHAAAQGQLTAQAVVRLQAADGEAAAMQIKQHRQPGVRRRVQAGRAPPPGGHRQLEIHHPSQRCAGAGPGSRRPGRRPRGPVRARGCAAARGARVRCGRAGRAYGE